MSLESWKKEFYPITANEAARKGRLAAAKHSLKKWMGLVPSSLKKHNVEMQQLNTLVECGSDYYDASDKFAFGQHTCSLCELQFEVHSRGECRLCPLFQITKMECGDAGSPYDEFCNTGSSTEMRAALKKIVAWLGGRKR